ncbi:MAG: hypothetical protein HY898_05630 [Deltaproteobacteria bacterium]|nr:hypothetical protein [Deltaproteobacteria bacterium]
MMHQELIEMVRASVGPSAGELVMTLGEQLIAQGRVEGLVKGRMEAVLCVLQARAISVPPTVLAKIQGCDDMNTLEQLLVRAATCSSAEELFD